MMRLFGVIAVSLVLVMGVYRTKIMGEKEMPVHEPHMTTHCIGRSIIGLPDGFQRAPVVSGIFKSADAKIQDQSFHVVVMENGFTKSSFSQAIDRRRSDLKENSDGTVDVLESEKVASDGAVVFRIRRIDDAHVSEINFLRGSSLVTVKLDSFRNEYVSAEERLIKFASAFTEVQDESSMQYHQHFCLGPVYIAGEFKDESASFLFKNSEGADFEAEINTYIPDPGKPLLTRVSGPDSLLAVFNIDYKILRSGERDMVNMRAQEWLASAKLGGQDEGKSLKFVLETIRKKPGKSAPSINLTFNTGKPRPDGGNAKTTISDDEAVRIWDKVIDSIRPAMP